MTDNELRARYPFLENASIEIPPGWNKMFEQMCEDILATGQYEELVIVQVKEKYNQLRVYAYYGSLTIKEIFEKYLLMSQYVCTLCGAPATVVEHYDYLASYCDDCYKAIKRSGNEPPPDYISNSLLAKLDKRPFDKEYKKLFP